MGEMFFHRSSAVFRRRTSDLVHLTICSPRIRSSQRIIARVEWELAIRRKLKQNKNKYLRNFDSSSYGSGMTLWSALLSLTAWLYGINASRIAGEQYAHRRWIGKQTS